MRLFRNKRGSDHGGGGGGGAVETTSAGGAAVLLALITLFIIFYILFLPPADRDVLLNNTGSGSSGNSDYNYTYLFERPGTLTYLTSNNIEHSLSAFTLYKTTQTQILESANSLYIKSNVFEKQTKQFSFSVDDTSKTDNYVLSFNTPEHTGRLTINLNGNVIFDNFVTTINPEPIKLPKNLVKQNNYVEFSVSGVGWRFWSSNSFKIDSITVYGDVTDDSKQSSSSDFYLDEEEYSNIQKATLRFNPDCKVKEVGQLYITVNGNDVFSGVPDCGVLNFKDIPKNFMGEGNNKITFRTTKGSYIVDNLLIEISLKKLNYRTYYFDMSEDDFNDLKSGKKRLNATLRFVNNDEYRRAKIIVNGHIMSVDAKDKLLVTRMIPKEYIEDRENNYIRIEPDKNTIEISQLRVFLYKP